MTVASGELPGVRVVDHSTGIAGAYCAKLFADAGADVVLCESPSGHPLRTWSCGGPVDDPLGAPLFRYLHHGVRSVTVGDAESALATLDGAHILITEPHATIGDPRSVAAANPELVVVSISPYGLTGPYADRQASELTIQADSGALAMRGRPEMPPFQAGGQITEWVTGVYAAVAGLAAVRGAQQSGAGELVDVSWAEVANLTCTMFVDVFDAVGGRPDTSLRRARTQETPSIEPTLDGYVGFNTNTRQQFEDFLVLIERPDLLADPSWASLGTRMGRFDEWNEIVHAWTTQHSTAEIVERAAMLRIPVSPVAPPRTLLDLDHAVARGVFVDDPSSSFRVPRRPWTIDGEPAPPLRPSPRLGEHAAEEPPRRPDVAGAAPLPRVAGQLPLAGVHVLDLTGWWAGPSSTAALAALGAEVIHVESIKHVDGIRMAGGAFFAMEAWWERSGFFLAANTNKRGLTLDLTHPRGRELLLELVREADVVVENFTPRVLESFDLGWDVIHATNPMVIMVRMPAFGLDGPWRDRPGFAQTMEQLTGLAWLTGHVDDQPRIERGPCDPNGGMHAAFATLVALACRDRTRVGCFVEAPMFEAALAVAAEPIVEWTAFGNELCRDGNRSHRAIQGVFECRDNDQWLAIAVADDDQWAALTSALGAPAWSNDPEMSTMAGRRGADDEIDKHLAAWAATLAIDDALAVLVDAGVPAAPAVDPRRTSLHPQFAARGFYETVTHPVVGDVATPMLPYRFGYVQHWLRNPAPTVGQHNEEILSRLGCSAADLDELTATGVIGTKPAGL